jgi:hypothetical protein
VRVEIREAAMGDMLIRLLEVRDGVADDVLLGAVQRPADACAVLLSWLSAITAANDGPLAGDGRLTQDRHPGGAADGRLGRLDREVPHD